MDFLHPQLLGPALGGQGYAPRNPRDLDITLDEPANPGSVGYMETLRLVTSLREPEAVVGEYTVDIEHQHGGRQCT